MTFSLSCLLEDRIAAIGMVAIPAPESEWCNNNQPVPMVVFQGMLDGFTPYEGGEHPLAEKPMPSMPDWIAQRAEVNGCDRMLEQIDFREDVLLTRYDDCEENAAVEFYTVKDGGHTWPGIPRMPERAVGKTAVSIHATEIMWDFFSRYTLD